MRPAFQSSSIADQDGHACRFFDDALQSLQLRRVQLGEPGLVLMVDEPARDLETLARPGGGVDCLYFDGAERALQFEEHCAFHLRVLLSRLCRQLNFDDPFDGLVD
jgi:hypothetical protein